VERDRVLRTIEETIGPFIGHHMAKASTQLHCQKLGIGEGTMSAAQLRSVLDGIGKGMFVLVGKEKTTELLRRIEKSLGIEEVHA
jgi:hypothetical protein